MNLILLDIILVKKTTVELKITKKILLQKEYKCSLEIQKPINSQGILVKCSHLFQQYPFTSLECASGVLKFRNACEVW